MRTIRVWVLESRAHEVEAAAKRHGLGTERIGVEDGRVVLKVTGEEVSQWQRSKYGLG